MRISWHRSIGKNGGWKMVYNFLCKDEKKTRRNIYLLLLKTSVWKEVPHFSVQCILTETTWLPTLKEGCSYPACKVWTKSQLKFSFQVWVQYFYVIRWLICVYTTKSTVNSEFFMRVLFLWNFAYETLTKRQNSLPVFWSKYSKTCVKQPLSKRLKKWFQAWLSLNAGQQYCRMLQATICY